MAKPVTSQGLVHGTAGAPFRLQMYVAPGGVPGGMANKTCGVVREDNVRTTGSGVWVRPPDELPEEDAANDDDANGPPLDEPADADADADADVDDDPDDVAAPDVEDPTVTEDDALLLAFRDEPIWLMPPVEPDGPLLKTVPLLPPWVGATQAPSLHWYPSRHSAAVAQRPWGGSGTHASANRHPKTRPERRKPITS